MLHRGARAAVEFAGDAGFVDGRGRAAPAPVIEIDGVVRRPRRGHDGVGARRRSGCPPSPARSATSSCAGRSSPRTGATPTWRARCTRSAWRTADARRAASSCAWRARSATGSCACARRAPAEDAPRVSRSANGLVLLEGSAQPGLVALALGADGDADVTVRRDALLARARRSTCGAGGERAAPRSTSPPVPSATAPRRPPPCCGAAAGARCSPARATRCSSSSRARAATRWTGSINRNLLFAYFYGVGRALDDAHYYLVRTRAPWHGAGVTVRDWEALMWTLPAVQLADTGLARELLLRMCELHAYAPGQRGALLRRHAVRAGLRARGRRGVSHRGGPVHPRHGRRRHRRRAGDRRRALPGERRPARPPRPARAAVLHRRHAVRRAGAACRSRCTRNAAVAHALDVLRRTLDEQTAREVEDPAAVRAAIRRHFALDRDPKATLHAAIDLAGRHAAEDEPSASALWLPLFEAVERAGLALPADGEGDSAGARAARAAASRGCSAPTATACSSGCAARRCTAGSRPSWWTPTGAAMANGGDAALSGLLARHGVVRGARAGREADDARAAPFAAAVAHRHIFARDAGIAQLVEHNLAKVGVAGSSPVSRSGQDARADERGSERSPVSFRDGRAGMAKLADARDLKSCVRKDIRVRSPVPASVEKD